MTDLSKKDQERSLAGYMDDRNGSFVYANSGYFSEVLDQEPSLEAFLTVLYQETESQAECGSCSAADVRNGLGDDLARRQDVR